MWYIFSANGLRGIERYSSKSEAEWAAELRNSLINQGWHPVRVAQATLFLAARLRLWRAVFRVINLLQKIKI